MDERLNPYLSATRIDEAQCLAALLRDHATPIVQRTVRSCLKGAWDDIEDVCAEAHLELLIHLRRIKERPAEAIRDFPAYVTSIASNACRQYFRRRRPGWSRLRRQLLYLLQHERQFRVSTAHDGRLICALEEWAPERPLANPLSVEHLAGQVEGDRDLEVLVRRIIDAAAGAVELTALTNVVARIWHIAPDPWKSASGIEAEAVAAPAEPFETLIDRQRYAANMWREVQRLPRPQRVALLMSLRDHRGSPMLALFPLSGICLFQDVAAALEISARQLASIWNDLPYQDRQIGELLGCTQQQVINLRMSARKRLSNRLKEER